MTPATVLTRKLWLFCLISKTGLRFFAFGLLIASLSMGIRREEVIKIIGSGNAFYFSFFSHFGMLFFFCGSLIYYYCAYKNPGRSLLTFTLICYIALSPLLLIDLYKAILLTFVSTHKLFDLLTLSYPPVDSLTACIITNCFIFMILLDQLLLPIWIYSSFKLRKINKALQLEKHLHLSEFNLAIENLQRTPNRKSLDLAYGEIYRNYPMVGWYIKQLYEESASKFTELS